MCPVHCLNGKEGGGEKKTTPLSFRQRINGEEKRGYGWARGGRDGGSRRKAKKKGKEGGSIQESG